jgi:manganese/zinc/iron transport system permease protein
MTVISAVLGGASGVVGVLASALFPRLAAGAVIVLAGSFLFLISLLFGTRLGVVNRAVQRFLRDRQIARDHLLRALFECLEPHLDPQRDVGEQLVGRAVDQRELLARRSWSPARLRRLIRASERDGYVVDYGSAGIKFTARGAEAAQRVVRNHRLWEIFLIEYADRHPSRVDRDADDIEHVLGPEVVARLERLLTQGRSQVEVPPSPHEIPAMPEGGPRP